MPRGKQKHSLKPNLYLLGFMGTGKSALGKKVAVKLGLNFLDSDAEIEKSEGKSISDIFAQKGEAYFRQLEKKFIESGHPDSGCVISCGGGMTCSEGMPELVKSKGVCIVLFTTPEEVYARTANNDKRPLLNVDDKLSKIRELMEKRRPYYMKSGIAIAANAPIKNTLDHIIRIYASRCKAFARKIKSGES